MHELASYSSGFLFVQFFDFPVQFDELQFEVWCGGIIPRVSVDVRD